MPMAPNNIALLVSGGSNKSTGLETGKSHLCALKDLALGQNLGQIWVGLVGFIWWHEYIVLIWGQDTLLINSSLFAFITSLQSDQRTLDPGINVGERLSISESRVLQEIPFGTDFDFFGIPDQEIKIRMDSPMYLAGLVGIFILYLPGPLPSFLFLSSWIFCNASPTFFREMKINKKESENLQFPYLATLLPPPLPPPPRQ